MAENRRKNFQVNGIARRDITRPYFPHLQARVVITGVWEFVNFGQLPEDQRALVDCRRTSIMVFGGFAGVWEFASFGLPELAQRAPGLLDRTTVL
tara:strand:- start:142 stop:426 length:285 start_codon:yes stop_codon:yes gene_type:complete